MKAKRKRTSARPSTPGPKKRKPRPRSAANIAAARGRPKVQQVLTPQRTALIHGQQIEGSQLEIETAAWDGRGFARLCNAVAWALTWRSGPSSIPAFTERVDVADNGVDAEWSRAFPDKTVPSDGLIRPGLNVQQYKKRTGGPANRGSVIARLKTDLRRALLAVEKLLGQQVASYVLWVNVDITPEQKQALRAEILLGLNAARKRTMRVEIVGAADLASMLNDLPHLRSAFLVRSSFQDWGTAFEAHRAQSIQLGDGASLPDLVGRSEPLDGLRQAVDDAAVRVLVLTGAHMVGKTRLALEATRHRDVDVVACLDQAITADALQRLGREGREAVVLVHDADPDTAKRLIRDALALGSALKLVITLPTQDGDLAPNFGFDNRVQIVPVRPLDDEAARTLLTVALGKQRLDYGLESWILEQAGGIPGIILAAASLGAKLRPAAGRFAEQVGEAFETKLRRLLPSPDALRSMQAASLLTHVRIRDEPSELEALWQFAGLTPNAFFGAVGPLERAGFLTSGGSYREAGPRPLATRLAAAAVRGRAQEVVTLFGALPDGGRKRLLRRLAQVAREDAHPVWSLLFAPEGPLGSFDAVLANASVYRAAAPAGVRQAVAIVRDGLGAMTTEERRTIPGGATQELVWALQDMLGLAATSEGAFRSLALLAEVEDDRRNGSAYDALCEAAFPLNPQVPLPLATRLAVLRDMLLPSRTNAAAVAALDVAQSAAGRSGTSVLRSSRGAVPAGGYPSGLTYPDVFAYRRAVLDMIAHAARDPRPAVRRHAKSVWPRAAEGLVYDGGENAKAAVAAFRTIVDGILAEDDELPVAETVDVLAYARLNVEWVAGRPANADDVLPQLLALVGKLKTGGYGVQLKWRLGNGWRGIDDEEEEDEAARASPFEAKQREIEALAKTACSDPSKLTDKLLAWSSRARLRPWPCSGRPSARTTPTGIGRRLRSPPRARMMDALPSAI